MTASTPPASWLTPEERAARQVAIDAIAEDHRGLYDAWHYDLLHFRREIDWVVKGYHEVLKIEVAARADLNVTILEVRAMLAETMRERDKQLHAMSADLRRLDRRVDALERAAADAAEEPPP